MTLRLAAAAWAIERPAGASGWLARLDREVARAASEGAQLILLPEYAALEAAAGSVPDLAAELAASVAQADALVAGACEIARRHGVYLVPGTMPFATSGKIVNRAPLIAPDGVVRTQDKHVMTRFEAEQWGVSGGAPPSVFETPWGRIGIAVCFDAEFPSLVRAQVEAGAWLILVPSCTDTLQGFSRVRLAAAARAMEGQCFVAVSPTLGEAPWCGALDRNHGFAAVYGPLDHGFADDGVIAETRLDEPGWLHGTLDRAALDAVRRHGAVRNFAAWPDPPPPCPVL